MPKAISGSSTSCVTRHFGSSDPNGSWKTICMRTAPVAGVCVFIDTSASLGKRIAPSSDGSRPSTRRATVLLPEPDSPTSPNDSPRRIVKSMPSDGPQGAARACAAASPAPPRRSCAGPRPGAARPPRRLTSSAGRVASRRARARASSLKWQAARRREGSATSNAGAGSAMQRARPFPERAAGLEAAAGQHGSGAVRAGCPGIVRSRPSCRFSVACGTASISAWVYGGEARGREDLVDREHDTRLRRPRVHDEHLAREARDDAEVVADQDHPHRLARL